MVNADWRERILLPLLGPDPASVGIPPDEQVIVFAADTDRTQAYVFESDKVPEIRGASRLLTALNRGDRYLAHAKQDQDREYYAYPAVERALWEEAELSADCILFSDGGSVLALLPYDPEDPEMRLARRVADRLKREYLDASGLVTISVAYRAFTIGQLLAGYTQPPQAQLPPNHQLRVEAYQRRQGIHFGEIILLMGSLLRAEKQRRHQPFMERMPFARVCRSCRSRPAIGFAFLGDPEPWPICGVCHIKLAWGGVAQRTFWMDELAGLLEDEKYKVDAAEYPQDLEQLAAGHEVALVYADGDGIGEKLHGLRTPNEYVAFSQALGEVTAKAVARAIAYCGLKPHQIEDPKRGRVHVHPWEVITIGGDDVMIIIPAANAPQFARILASEFCDLVREDRRLEQPEGSRPLTMSVGYAIGKFNTPVRRLRDAAKMALKQAKGKARDLWEQHERDEVLLEAVEPCIDYHNFVTEGLPGFDFADWRLNSRIVGEGASKALTIGRPYTLTEFGQLSDSLRVLARARFPRSQLHLLCDGLNRSVEQGAMLYYYQRTRLDREKRTALLEIEETWGAMEDHWPWLHIGRDEYTYRTVLQDIVDSYDFYRTDAQN